MDLKDYKLPEIVKGRTAKKPQRLAIQIINWCRIPDKGRGFWWRQCAKSPEFIEAKFLELKKKGIRNATYLRKMVFNK